MTVRELYEKLNRLYPPELSAQWDNDGVMLCPDGDRTVRKVLCCLDANLQAVRQALLCQVDVILSHHPMIFHPVRNLDCADPAAAKAMLLIRKGISVLSFHTRLDCAENGVNDTLASMFDIETKSNWVIEGLPLGRIVTLKSETSGKELALFVKERLGCPFLRYVNPGRRIKSVALVGGSGGEFAREAAAAGVDAFLTGEANYHELLDADEAGLCLIAAGHDYTERPVVRSLCAALERIDPAIEAVPFEEISVPAL